MSPSSEEIAIMVKDRKASLAERGEKRRIALKRREKRQNTETIKRTEITRVATVIGGN